MMGKLQSLKSSIKLDFSKTYDLSRDGGTGRRSGLKIRRASALGGSTPPPGTTACKVLILNTITTCLLGLTVILPFA